MPFIEFKTSMGGLESLIARLKEADRNTLQDKIGQIVIGDILSNTAKGVNVDGQTFKPYSESYAKYGRLGKGYNTNPVDLKRTGDMLSSLEVRKEGIMTIIDIADEEKTKAEGNTRWRKFIGVSSHTRDKLKELVREFVGNIIKK